VQGHPNVEKLVGLFHESDEIHLHSPSGLALATQVHAIGSLYCVVMGLGKYQEFEALQLARGLLQALAHIHACGLAHTNVSSKTILMRGDGAPVLSQFGKAVHTRHSLDSGKVAHDALGKRAQKEDVFDAGLAIYFAVAGQQLRKQKSDGQAEEVDGTEKIAHAIHGCQDKLSPPLFGFLSRLVSNSRRRRPLAADAMEMVPVARECRPRLLWNVHTGAARNLPGPRLRSDSKESQSSQLPTVEENPLALPGAMPDEDEALGYWPSSVEPSWQRTASDPSRDTEHVGAGVTAWQRYASDPDRDADRAGAGPTAPDTLEMVNARPAKTKLFNPRWKVLALWNSKLIGG
jgi:serine/threonine protein kinase